MDLFRKNISMEKDFIKLPYVYITKDNHKYITQNLITLIENDCSIRIIINLHSMI